MEISTEKQRNELGGLIKRNLVKCKFRQMDLANELSITPAAVSQMMKGKIIPNFGQLEKIARKLQCDRHDQFQMQMLVAEVKSRGKLKHSIMNDELRQARKERHMSLSRLSELTGISVSDLKLFENNPFIVPEANELKGLCNVLELDAGRFAVYQTAENAAAAYAIREETSAYSAEPVSIPCMDLRKLETFQPCWGKLETFVAENSRDHLPCKKEYAKLWAVKARQEDLSLFNGLDATLIIDREEAKNNGDIVLMRQSSNGKFALKRFVRKPAGVILEALIPGEDAIVWNNENPNIADFLLPVIEISFQTSRAAKLYSIKEPSL